ncbi:glycosyltransferase family 2 protein [Paenibacillus sp. LS1]|uniref:glycosyltransferase family 2 protein n=1 Tax=Paenibacillus sp. LS1 TaxID=2992120 RepID=UPI002230280D|nr:glycosyltransferase family 2 protein [Paenibacillus sp. LS1]MCW3795113.1 glycosyltransferase family 2 protein [Paenibacillus sp. LS1]
MQGKVSMVMPCYNKVKYIGQMFDSILAQEWDNIELILVNDGSTDGTRDVISQYEPMFRKRGYEVIIEDQTNAGVCAAAKVGLALATGNYICMIDSDDELDPKYVSVMAGFLDEHDQYDYCICDAVLYTGTGINKEFKPLQFSKLNTEEPLYTERYLLTDIRSEVWVYLVRADYLNQCNIIENYYTDTKGSHEPGYIIPLTMYSGRYKYFPLALYHFNVGDIGHSHHVKYEQAQRFYDEYHRLSRIAVNQIPESIVDYDKKQHITNVSLLSKHINLYRHAQGLIDGHSFLEQAIGQMVETINKVCKVSKSITIEMLCGKEELFIVAAKNKILTVPYKGIPDLSKKRIVGYGVLGKIAKTLLPLLQHSQLEPTELWDISGDGDIVKKPDFSSLSENDAVLVFPTSEQVLEDVEQSSPCVVYSASEVQYFVSHLIKENYLS